MPHFDLVIIGSGSGNSIADERFADWNVAFVEKGIGSASSYGGTCLNVGCIPTKMLVHTADVAAAPGAGSRLGVDLELRDVRWRDIRDRIFGRIDAISDGGRRYRAAGSDNVTLFEGEARFTGIKQLTVETADGPETLTADRFVVAAGGRPTTPDIPGIDATGFHTSDSVMRLDALPPRMIILGTGFVGAEFAHVFSALGVEVTVIGRSGRLLRAEDVDVSERFTELAAERWDVRLNRKALAAERDGDVVRLHLEGPDGAETVEAEQLLVAVGREPNSDLIDAETGGLRLRFDAARKVCRVDRSGMDRRFNVQVGEALDMPLEAPLKKLRVFIDRSSVEIFANDGEATFTTHAYPTEREFHCCADPGVGVRIWPMRRAVTDAFVV